MNDPEDTYALELRVERARARVHDRIERIEERGRELLHTARNAARAAVLLAVAASAVAVWLLGRGFARRRR